MDHKRARGARGELVKAYSAVMNPPPAPDPRLDRRIHFDPESRNFAIRTLLPPAPPRSYTWAVKGTTPAVLDQGREGACVGFGWAAELAARPHAQTGITNQTALDLYHLAQTLDDEPGEAYSGTSVLAGAKAAQKSGHIKSYWWATSLQEVVAAIGYHGPVVLGINWYAQMYETGADGWVRGVGVGEPVGGHCILLRGVRIVWRTDAPPAASGLRRFEHVDTQKSYGLLRNSWSASWGIEGDGKIRLADLDVLLHAQGEACAPVKC